MKIAINTRFLLKNKLEGIGWYTYEVVKHLVEQHPEDEFIFFFDRPYDEAFIFGANVKPVVLFPPARHPLLWCWWFEIAIPKALKKYKPDVFFSPDGYLSLSAKTKTLLTVHDIAPIHFPEQVPWFVRKYYKTFIPRFLQRANRILAVSDYTKMDMVQHFDVKPEKIEISYNACRDTFQPLQPEIKKTIRDENAGGSAYFFYVGAVHPRKNVHRLIEAFDAFKKQPGSSIKLLIAGRFSWQTGAVKTAYDHAACKKDIIFLGYVDDEKLPQLMGAALALVYVSLFEGFGVPLLEAMHCDVPVITSERTSMPEIVGKAGKLLDPDSVADISAAMRQIVESEPLRKEMIEEGRFQRKKFTWESAAQVVYDALLKTAY